MKTEIINAIKANGVKTSSEVTTNAQGITYRFNYYIIDQCPKYLGAMYRKLATAMATRSYGGSVIKEHTLNFENGEAIHLAIATMKGRPDGQIQYRELELV